MTTTVNNPPKKVLIGYRRVNNSRAGFQVPEGIIRADRMGLFNGRTDEERKFLEDQVKTGILERVESE